jgi:hypothetical protein
MFHSSFDRFSIQVAGQIRTPGLTVTPFASLAQADNIITLLFLECFNVLPSSCCMISYDSLDGKTVYHDPICSRAITLHCLRR